ncbi:hypothetical protein ACI7YT_12515 [Microbacterium sp. M]|uniref:hypothetical protein n=1 Tax=Microbacterium sp. M TaxID=3377125 RepID=UPI003867226F
MRLPKTTPVLILSFHEPDSNGGFNWALDTPERRAEWIETAKRDADDYRDVILIAARLNLDGMAPQDVTDVLDSELVFESGRVGEILYRSERWENEA